MLPSSEADVISALQMTRTNLTNNNQAFSAYPQLIGPFHQMASDLDLLIETLITTQREELLFGKTPAAKLYELQFRQAHAVPSGVLKSVNPDRRNETAPMPLLQILKYAKNVRRSTAGTIKYTFDHIEEPATESTPATTRTAHVTLDIGTMEAFITWAGCVVRARLPSFDCAEAFVEGPLFHEPIRVSLDVDMLGKALWAPVYSKLIGSEHIDVPEGKCLLMTHYFASGRVSSDDVDHPVVKLRALLNDNLYGRRNSGYAEVEWNGYIVQLSTKRDYSHLESLQLTVNVLECSDRPGQIVSNWWKNPLLVNDLLKDMDDIIDQLLTCHDREEAELKSNG